MPLPGSTAHADPPLAKCDDDLRARGSNWDEQRLFDKVNSVDPSIKNRGFHYNHVESVKHDKKCPPTMVSAADEPMQVLRRTWELTDVHADPHEPHAGRG